MSALGPFRHVPDDTPELSAVSQGLSGSGASHPADSPIEAAIYREMHDLIGAETMREMVKDTAGRLQAFIEAFSADLPDTRLEDLRHGAHALKSAFAHFGALQASNEADALEAAARQHDYQACARQLPRFITAAGAAIAALEQPDRFHPTT